MKEKEVWKWIRGYCGTYKVSSLGRIKSVARYIIRIQRGKEIRQFVRKRYLRSGVDPKTGYLGVMLCLNMTKRRFLVHALVCRAFHGPKPTPKHEVNHKGKDGNKLNNRADNLEWVTRRENQKHAYKNGLHGFVTHGNPSPYHS